MPTKDKQHCSECKKYRRIAYQDYGLCLKAAAEKEFAEGFGGPLRWSGGCCAKFKQK